MLGLPLAFTLPLVLTALAALPVLYYLLRLTPPRPRQVSFPPLKLILDLKPKEETPARTPWWLLLLRLLLAALVILAMAGPIWNPTPASESGRGPLLVLLDDGWPGAVQWDRRIAAASEALTTAAREGRPGAVLPMSDAGREIIPADPQALVERLRALKPAPYLPDRMKALAPLKAWLARNKEAQILWIADGIETGDTRKFGEELRAAAGSNNIRALLTEKTPAIIASAENAPGALEVVVRRADSNARPSGILRAYDLKGLSIGDAPFNFGTANEAKTKFELPIELRNEIARIEIYDEHNAGAVTLLDSRWKRRRVSIVSGATADTAQPLLAPSYFLTRALQPFAEVREPKAGNLDPVLAALDDKPSVIVFADVGIVAKPVESELVKFVEQGGVLLRFAGSRLAAGSDDLVPVKLRRGGRVLGGALSWEQPRKLAPFERESPFFGLEIPGEVVITRQVLAEPEIGLPGKTWATLDDGTPLITAVRRGKGLVVLVHVTADMTWSNLPLSGLFVDFLRRTIAMAGEGEAGEASGTSNAAKDAEDTRTETLAPTRILDGFGVFGSPPVTARPVPVNYTGRSSLDFPPGFYGPREALRAVNTLKRDDTITRADFSGLNIEMQTLQTSEPVDLRPWIIALAMLLFLADAIASILLAGGLRIGPRRIGPGKAAAAAIAGLLAILSFAPDHASAQTPTAPANPAASVKPPALNVRDLESVLKTRLAYIVTGNSAVDEASKLGLAAVSSALRARTALSPGEPIGVDPARDELAFYPMLYWPVVANLPQPQAQTVTRIAAFMKEGGTILFDTRDALLNRPGETPTAETAWLRRLLSSVDVPELEPVPRDHVITKTFYLLDRLIGRYMVGQTWIEALPAAGKEDAGRPTRAGDSVSPIIITSNDLAAAWAVDARGQGLFPLQPGAPRQREFAIRSGVNIVMYTLTGNYKADQVHAKDILDRLGL